MNELKKYGGEGMLTMMVVLYNWIWKNDYVTRRWREGVVVNFFKNGDKADPGNYRGITVISTTGKTICKTLNNSIRKMMEKEGNISEGQSGFRPNRSYVDHVYPIGKVIQGRKDAGLTTYVLCFLQLMYRRPVTQYGEMGCGKSCVKSGSEGRCGEG